MMKKNSLQYKIFCSFVLIAVVIIIVMLPLVYLLNRSINNQNIQKSNFILEENVRTVEHSVENSLTAIYDVFVSDYLKELDFSKLESKNNYHSINLLVDFLRKEISNKGDIANLSIYIKQFDGFICVNGFLNPEEYYSIFYSGFDNYDDWYDLFINNNKMLCHKSDRTNAKKMYYKFDADGFDKTNLSISVIAEIKPSILDKVIDRTTTEGMYGVAMYFADCDRYLVSGNVKKGFSDGKISNKYISLRKNIGNVDVEYIMLLNKSQIVLESIVVWTFFSTLCLLIFLGVLFYVRNIRKTSYKALFDLFEDDKFKVFKSKNSNNSNADELMLMQHYLNHLHKTIETKDRNTLFMGLVNNFSDDVGRWFKDRLIYDKYLVLVIGVKEDVLDILNRGGYISEEIRVIFINVFTELFSKYFVVEGEQIGKSFCFIINSDDFDRENVFSIINDGKAALKDHFDLDISVGIGSTVDRLEYVTFSYYEAVSALAYSIKTDKQVVFYSDIVREEAVKLGVEPYGEYIEQKNVEQMLFLIKSKIDDVVKNKPYDERTKSYIFDVIKKIIQQANLESFIDNSGLKECIDDSISYEDLIHKISAFLENGISDIKLKRDNRETRIKKYIDENYNNINLSVSGIADFFDMNAIYIERIFKNAYNETISSYIFRIRFEKAKQLLIESDKKVSDIAMEVGYSNQSFSRAFKKSFGCSPTEFRLKYRK